MSTVDAGAEAVAAAPELAALRAVARYIRSVEAARVEIARLAAELTLPSATIHVVSDVHGEHVKLRHIINNASGALRPLVERVLGDRPAAEVQQLLALLFYPRETLAHLAPAPDDAPRLRAFAEQMLMPLLAIVRALAARHSVPDVIDVFPPTYRSLARELLYAPAHGREPAYVAALLDALVLGGAALRVIHVTVRVVRDLAIDELIVAGDLFDRGPRADRVLGYLQRQPNVAFAWGNHDIAWLGACLGQEALIAHVLRISLRYRRLSQLEEGYGITLQPLEHLVRTVYADDPAACFQPRGQGLRETAMVARMQKAAAIMQFKLEGQTIQRHPEMELAHRALLHRIDLANGTIAIDGAVHPLRDTAFPTIDPAAPYALSPAERTCMDRLRQSFVTSQPLWEHMRFLIGRGAMYLRRDDHLIFHGCVPVDEHGAFLAFPVDGVPRRGRALFDALQAAVVRSLEAPREADLDLLWYLWCGPCSPLFGKDRITTLERDLVADTRTHEETKNPYFRLIHEGEFCARVLAEFDVDPARGLIVNGHVPVQIEQGETPLKRGGRAVTIDGAFSEAYGDRGYTLVIQADRTYLAMHHHFESVDAAVRDGVDIIPTISVIREHAPPRRLADTARGAELRGEIALLEHLVAAYRRRELREIEA